MVLFDRIQLKILPLSQRKSKSDIQEIALNPDMPPPHFEGDYYLIENIADAIIHSKKASRSVIIAFGAHVIKNGLGTVLRKLIEGGWITESLAGGVDRSGRLRSGNEGQIRFHPLYV